MGSFPTELLEVMIQLANGKVRTPCSNKDVVPYNIRIFPLTVTPPPPLPPISLTCPQWVVPRVSASSITSVCSSSLASHAHSIPASFDEDLDSLGDRGVDNSEPFSPTATPASSESSWFLSSFVSNHISLFSLVLKPLA